MLSFLLHQNNTQFHNQNNNPFVCMVYMTFTSLLIQSQVLIHIFQCLCESLIHLVMVCQFNMVIAIYECIDMFHEHCLQLLELFVLLQCQLAFSKFTREFGNSPASQSPIFPILPKFSQEPKPLFLPPTSNLQKY
jgi:hypothetical protein